MVAANGRSSAFDIHPIFLERWSPRAFTGEAIGETELMTILEAARWSPSAYNSQPWRFLYGRRDTPAFETLLGLLSPLNQSWAKQAGALLVVASRKMLMPPNGTEEVASYSHSFDAGAAWGVLALQATLLGWHAHAMVGFDRERALTALKVPETYRVEAAVAIGRKGDPASLPEALARREKPSDRMALADIALEGGFP